MKSDVDLVTSGTMRLVLLIGDKVVKVAKNLRGAAANQFEFDLWQRSTETRRAMLCPPISVYCQGQYLVAMRAEALAQTEFDALLRNGHLPDWDYNGDGDIPDPTEDKAHDWGRFEGRLVRVDYAATSTVMNVPDTALVGVLQA